MATGPSGAPAASPGEAGPGGPLRWLTARGARVTVVTPRARLQVCAPETSQQSGAWRRETQGTASPSGHTPAKADERPSSCRAGLGVALCAQSSPVFPNVTCEPRRSQVVPENLMEEETDTRARPGCRGGSLGLRGRGRTDWTEARKLRGAAGTHSLLHTLTHTLTYTHTYTLMHTLTCTHARAHTCTLTCTHTHMHTCAHTCTQSSHWPSQDRTMVPPTSRAKIPCLQILGPLVHEQGPASQSQDWVEWT